MRRRADLAVGLTLSLCACGGSGARVENEQGIPPPADASLEVVNEPMATMICGHPDEAAIRGAVRATLPACDGNDVRVWRFTANEHRVAIVQHRGRAGDARLWEARQVFVDGAAVSEAEPAPLFHAGLGDLRTLSRDDAHAFLEAYALTGPLRRPARVFGEFLVTPSEVDAFTAERSASVHATLTRHPPGFGRDEHGWRLRVYEVLPPEQGMCAVLARTELTLADGEVVVHPPAATPLDEGCAER